MRADVARAEDQHSGAEDLAVHGIDLPLALGHVARAIVKAAQAGQKKTQRVLAQRHVVHAATIGEGEVRAKILVNDGNQAVNARAHVMDEAAVLQIRDQIAAAVAEQHFAAFQLVDGRHFQSAIAFKGELRETCAKICELLILQRGAHDDQSFFHVNPPFQVMLRPALRSAGDRRPATCRFPS